MPEDITGSLEQQIDALERQIQEKRAELGKEQTTPYERQEVRDIIVEQSPQPSAPIEAMPQEMPADVPSALQPYIDIALTKGPGEAIAEVRKLGNPALTDALHDALADVYHQKLLETHKLEPVV
jgi:hypothetical protein